MKALYFLVGCALLLSCSKKEYSEAEMQALLIDEGNGYVQTIERNGVKMQLVYKPTDLLVNQELKGKDTIKPETIEALRKHYGQFAYFTLHLSPSSAENNGDAYASLSTSFQEYSENIQKFSFRLNQYVYMTDVKGDTSYLQDFNTPRMYSFSKQLSSLLVFRRPKAEGTLKVQCRNLLSFTSHEIFSFDSEKLTNEPRIRFGNK